MRKLIILLAICLFTPIPETSASSLFKSDSTISKSFTPIIHVFGSANQALDRNYSDFNITRAHIGLIYNYGKNWTAKLILDRGRPSQINDITVTDRFGQELKTSIEQSEGSHYTMFLKFASLKYQVNKYLSLEAGLLLQNHYITQEAFWEYRYVAQTFQDMYWHIPSTDFGIMARYKLAPSMNFDFAITNGEGSRRKQDSEGDMKYAAGIDLWPDAKLKGRIFYHFKPSTQENYSNEKLYSLFMGYSFKDKVKLGGEFNHMENLYNQTDLNSYGFSFYSTWKFYKQIGLFARYDHLYNKSNLENHNLNEDNGFLCGLDYSLQSAIHFSINYHKNEFLNSNNIQFNIEYKL